MKQKRQRRASKKLWSSRAAAKRGFTVYRATDAEDRSAPTTLRDPAEEATRTEGEERLAGSQGIGRAKMCQFVGANFLERHSRAAPLLQPFLLLVGIGEHSSSHYETSRRPAVAQAPFGPG